MDALTYLGEQRITRAIARGELDDIPGQGRPLDLEDLTRLAPELRSAYLVLKNSGHLPEEMQLRKDMVQLRDLIATCRDDGTRHGLHERLTAKTIRYETLMQSRGITVAYAEYADAIRRRLDGAS